ncbi:hypothetical protein [Enterobacter kobei]|uniref:hypothetical protein n=1 Tax=Enterobacter kobei TaxID=208224 RepID=UPI003A976701
MKTTFSIVNNQDLCRRKSTLRGTAAVPEEMQQKITEVDMRPRAEGIPELYLFQSTGSVTLRSGGKKRDH